MSSLRRTAVFSALYVLATYAGRLTVMDATNLSLVWPSAGVLAVWFVAQRRSRLRWVDAVSLAGITMAVNLWTGTRVELALFFTAANLLQAFVFVALFGRWLPDVWVAGGRAITRLSEFWRFVAIAALATVAGATVGPTGIWLVSGHYAIDSTSVWLARNVVSILIVGVALSRAGYVYGRIRDGSAGRIWRSLRNHHLLEYGVVLALSTAGYVTVFGSNRSLPVAFCLVVMTIWAGLRLRTTFVIVHDLLFGTVAIIFTLYGTGPFALIVSHSMRSLVAQLFVGTIAVVGLALALGRDERDALIEQLRDSEHAAREQARTMTAIVDSMAEGIGVVDQTGRLRLRNPAMTRLLGVRSPTGHIAENGFYGLFHPDGTPLAEDEKLYLSIFDGTYTATDLLIRNATMPEGRVVHVTGTEMPPTADGGREALIVVHDVTADRRHRDELAKFAGVVAHDLLNPLTTIEGWSETLADEIGPDGGTATDSVVRIRRSAARMRSLINGLLAYTTARDASLAPTSVDLDDMVHDIATGRLDHAQSTSAPMPRIDIGELPAVDADPVLARQLLENLIGNAIKYTAPGVVPHVTVRSETTGRFAHISVEDNGIGIPPGEHQAIFQNFHRAHVGAGYAGTGLGLAICKRIVERHGGTITAADTGAGGSRMTFTLPVPAGR